MSRMYERRIQKEFLGEVLKNGSPFLKFVFRWYWLPIVVLLFGGILGTVLTGNELFVLIGFVGLGLFMLFLVVAALLSFSLGQMKEPDPSESEKLLPETQSTLRVIKEMSGRKNDKRAKLWLFVFYGWIFLVVLACPVCLIAGESLGWGVFSFTGFFLFGGTLFALIIFGAFIPSIFRGKGIKSVRRDRNAHEVNATIKEVKLISSASVNDHIVSEKYLLIFDTPYGESKTTYKITPAHQHIFPVGENLLVLINSSKPKYCAIVEEESNY